MKKHDNDQIDRITVSVFDRTIGALHGLPDVCSTRSSTLRVVPPLGVGSVTYIVQTYRQKEQGDTVFLESISDTETIRLVIPPAVTAAIARQRDMLTTKTRSKASKAVAADRIARGEIPFIKKVAK